MKPGARRKQVQWDRTTHLKIAGWFLLFFAVMVGGFVLRSEFGQRQDFDRELAAWKVEYRLSEEQTAQIRRIEEDFHGTGNVFTQPTHTFEALMDHERAISRVMVPEEAARFLVDRERIAKSQKRRVRAHAH